MAVLYIEDEYIPNKRYIKAILNGFTNARWVDSISKARQVLSQDKNYRVILCDGLIVDENVPSDDVYDAGLNFLRELNQSNHPDKPILILFSVRHDLPVRSLNEEGIHVLLKHISEETLIRQIEELIRNSEL